MLWWPNWCPHWSKWPNRQPNVPGDQFGGQNWNYVTILVATYLSLFKGVLRTIKVKRLIRIALYRFHDISTPSKGIPSQDTSMRIWDFFLTKVKVSGIYCSLASEDIAMNSIANSPNFILCLRKIFLDFSISHFYF